MTLLKRLFVTVTMLRLNSLVYGTKAKKPATMELHRNRKLVKKKLKWMPEG